MPHFRNTLAALLILGVAFIPTTPASAAFNSAMPIGDLPGWHQTFTEQFNAVVPVGGFSSSALATKFRAYGPSLLPNYVGWKDTSKHGRYMPEIISVENGILTKHLQTKNDYAYVAALSPRLPDTQAGTKYGRYSVKFRSDRLPGYKVAWMLWPDAGNNTVNGEIDFPEMDLDTTEMHGFMHMTNQVAGPTQQGWSKTTIDLNKWNVATIEWSPNLVVFIFNGVEVKRFTERVPTVPMHWVLQTETALGVPAPAATVKGNVQIAWVATWAYAP